jgi:hypothetical protein
MKLINRLSIFLLLFSFFSFAFIANAQEQTERKRTPRLTTDDVTSSRVSRTTETPAAEAGANKVNDAAKTTASKSATATKNSDAASQKDTKDSAEELAWRNNVSQARHRADDLQRSAEEMELRTTQLRNDLNTPGQGAKDRNAIAQEMEQAGKEVTRLRNEAREADRALKALLEVGGEKGFKEEAGPKPTTKDGKTNNSYYRQRYEALNKTMSDAERRVQLYENRLRNLNETLTNPNRDRFSGGQLEQDRAEVQSKLEEARAAYVKAQTDLQKLMDEAKRAGVEPGVFRQ